MEDFEPKENGDFWKAPDRYLHGLKYSENKFLRKKILLCLQNEVSLLSQEAKAASRDDGDGDGPQAEVSEAFVAKRDLLASTLPLIVKATLDPMERCREMAYETLSPALTILRTDEKFMEVMPGLFPTFMDRFGSPEILEPSEEVRLIAVRLFHHLINLLETKELLPYTDDLTQILAFLIVDPYHSVRIGACVATGVLAKKACHVFAASSDRLLAPLCKILSHQQYRVRVAAMECLGDVALSGNHKSFGEVLPHVTQTLFDTSPAVRSMTVAVASNWLLNFVDRYSSFTKLLPIILTGLNDESPEVSTLATSLWHKVGDQYLQENLQDYKDEVDFEKPGGIPSEYRPPLGCRILVWRHVGNMVPGVSNDITDWSVSTRIKCAQILHQMLLHSEEKMTMHTQLVLKACTLAIGDENSTVVKFIWKSCNLLGFFVPLNSTLPNMITSIQSTSNVAPVKVLWKVLEGSTTGDLDEHVSEIAQVLAEPDLCQSLNPTKQLLLMNIANTLAAKCSPEKITSALDGKVLFRAAFSVYSMAKSAEVGEGALGFLKAMAEREGKESLEELVDLYGGDILEDIRKYSSDWTSLSPNKLLFEKLLSHGSLLTLNKTEMIVNIMISNLGPERDPQVRLRFFVKLSEIFQFCKVADQKEEQLNSFIESIVKDVLTPNLTWVAGKSASALRTAASSCILSLLRSDLLGAETLDKLTAEVVTPLLGLLDDSSLVTRLIGCHCIEVLATKSLVSFTPEVAHKVYLPLLKRLDDTSNEARLAACQALLRVVESFCLPGYDVDFYRVHTEGIASVLIVHYDDDAEEIRNVIYEIFLKLARVNRDIVSTTCESFRTKHRTSDYCDKLLVELKKMDIDDK